MSSFTAPSHQKSKCYYCKKEFSRFDSLKRHSVVAHPNSPIRTEGPKSKSLSDFFSTPLETAETIDVGNSSSSKADAEVATGSGNEFPASKSELPSKSSVSSRLSKFAYKKSVESSDDKEKHASESDTAAFEGEAGEKLSPESLQGIGDTSQDSLLDSFLAGSALTDISKKNSEKCDIIVDNTSKIIDEVQDGQNLYSNESELLKDDNDHQEDRSHAEKRREVSNSGSDVEFQSDNLGETPKKVAKLSFTDAELATNLDVERHLPPKTKKSTSTDEEREDLKAFLDEKITQVLLSINELKDSLKDKNQEMRASEKPEKALVSVNIEDKNEYVQFLKECKTVEALLENLKDFDIFQGETENYLHCALCGMHGRLVPDNLTVGINVQNRYGFIHIPSKEEEAVGPAGGLSQKFRNFRRNLITHIENDAHVFCERIEYGRKADTIGKVIHTEKEINLKIGMRVVRVAYSAVKEGKGGRYFEREVSLMDLNGVNMGEINHSREFYRDMRTKIYNVIKSKIIQYLTKINEATNQLPLASLTADKITIQRRTLQITCLATMVDGVKRVILIDLTPCGESHKGKHLTKLLQASMDEFSIQLKQQMNGMAFDGQYFHLSVPQKIAELADLDEDFLTPQWDIAHQIELSLEDCKKEQTSQWIVDQIQIIGAVMKKFKWGILYEELRSLAEELKVRCLEPKGFQTTRFVQSELRVNKTFIEDFEIFFTWFCKKREKAIRKGDSTEAKEFQIQVTNIAKVNFIFRVLFTTDILSILTEFSCIAQKVDVTLWDIYQMFTSVISKLEKIQSALSKFEVCQELELLCTHINDLKLSQFKGKPLNTFVGTGTGLGDSEGSGRITLRSHVRSHVTGTETETFSAADSLSVSVSSETETEINQNVAGMDSDSSNTSSLSNELQSAFKTASTFTSLLVTKLNVKIKEPKYVKDMRNCFSWIKCLHIQKCQDNSETIPLDIQESLCNLVDLVNKNRGTKFVFDTILNEYTFLWINMGQFPSVKMDELPELNTKKSCLINEKITQYIFTKKEIFSQCHDFLFIFENFNKLSNETVCETIGSIIGSQLYNRTCKTMNLMKEVFIRWNGPKVENADNILSAALRDQFSNFPFPHFIRVTKQKSKLKKREKSAVVDRLRSEEDRLPFLK